MHIIKRVSSLCFIFAISFGTIAQSSVSAQRLTLGKQHFELHNVTGEIVKFQGKKVLKIERDLNAIPFDVNNIEATVDEPHYARLIGFDDFENGTIEVKMYNQLQILCHIRGLPDSLESISGFKKMIQVLKAF